MLAASYGSVNAGGKWQEHSDSTVYKLDLEQVLEVLQLFYYKKNELITLIGAKVVDDILIAGKGNGRKNLTRFLKTYYDMSTTVHTPGTYPFS